MPLRALKDLRDEMAAREAIGEPVDLQSVAQVAQFVTYTAQGGSISFDDDGRALLVYDAGQGLRTFPPEAQDQPWLAAFLSGLIDSCRDVVMTLRMLAFGR